MSLDTDEYEGKSVLILGNGNSAFETADHIAGVTNLVHLLGRSKVRLAWDTHYVGDLRYIRNLRGAYLFRFQNFWSAIQNEISALLKTAKS